MPVVVVESPAKAKTINKYLGPGYTVLASYGHVRDLPPKDGSVDPDNDFFMKWQVSTDSRKHVKAIADALAQSGELILATDPDREGEAISWHLQEALMKRRSIKKTTPVSRVTFNAITKEAVTRALQSPRPVDKDLVEAYLARRALDYLVGFNLSPVLWRKLPGARSAGRVQSVCLRLIVEREMEIEAFRPREYWSVKAILGTPRGQDYEARLIVLAGQKLDRYSIENQTQAELAVQAINACDLLIHSVEAKPASRNPSAPFMTSTLQQEASRKFGMGARQTMNAAQRLYEAGHITYMRTDGIDMAPEAVTLVRDAIAARFGQDYVPKSPRVYKNKAKNAQEAHECIRPTDMEADAGALGLSDRDQNRLYDLIWKRTLACQMEAAKMERTTVGIGSADGQVGLRATGQVVLFDGFLRVYEEGKDDAVIEEEDRRLPRIIKGEAAEKRSVSPEQHFTQPPPRYTEATLVKRMEELGIGRPSTYASVVTTIQEREYVRKEKNRLFPEDKGRIVTTFLLNFFRKYVGYEFTANLEDELDTISAGSLNYKDVLERFWRDFSAAVSEASELRIAEVLDVLDSALSDRLYPQREDGSDPRLCPKCGTGRLHLKMSRTGGFVGCGNYPECAYTRPIAGAGSDDERMLGVDQEDGIWLKSGRFGPYVQRGEPTPENKKPPRASLPRGWDKDAMDLEKALALLSLPRHVGDHPEGGAISANSGRFGPYIMHQGADDSKPVYVNLKGPDEIFKIGMNRAVELLAEKRANPGRGRGASAKPLKELGAHPDNAEPVQVMDGRYGTYVKWGKINATLPGDLKAEDMTLAQALPLLAEKVSKTGTRKKTTARKSTTKRPAARNKKS